MPFAAHEKFAFGKPARQVRSKAYPSLGPRPGIATHQARNSTLWRGTGAGPCGHVNAAWQTGDPFVSFNPGFVGIRPGPCEIDECPQERALRRAVARGH